MSPASVRLTVCGLLLAVAACMPRPSTILAPTILPATPTALPPTPTLPAPTATSIPATLAPTAIPQQLISELDIWFSQLGEEGSFTGSVLVAQNGNILLSEGYGLADREKHIANTPQTRFRLGSITKQFTAMAILILQAQGQLNVQDPICNYIADCPSTWETITIHHLLTHTSGIPNFLGDYPIAWVTPAPPEGVIARFKDLPLDFQPGDGWNYSNSGYVVLGYIIEQVSGQSYEAFLQEAIFTPLDLRDTGYDHNSNDLAVGYSARYSDVPADFIDMSIPYAAGALYSTVEDLYQWDQALYTEQLLQPADLEPMFAPHVIMPDDSGWAYGYGWVVGQDHGRRILVHAGGINGFATVIARYPDEQVTLILLSNYERVDIRLIRELLSKKIFGEK